MTFFLPDRVGRSGGQRGRGPARAGRRARNSLSRRGRPSSRDVAQFTPRTVETPEERPKLTFRIKAHIDPELLKKYISDVKTGLPGMAYVQLDPQAEWPEHLRVWLPEHGDRPVPTPKTGFPKRSSP